MNRETAKAVGLKVAAPRTTLIVFEDNRHKIIETFEVRRLVECGEVIDVGPYSVKVTGWGPIDATECRAICTRHET